MKARPMSGEKSSNALSRDEFAAERARTARRNIPELIDLLESEDLRTRFVAEMCLRDAANT
jgi:hypothetical protein